MLFVGHLAVLSIIKAKEYFGILYQNDTNTVMESDSYITDARINLLIIK